jgi:hypothetical protein
VFIKLYILLKAETVSHDGFLRIIMIIIIIIIIIMTVKVKVKQSHNTPMEAQGEGDV